MGVGGCGGRVFFAHESVPAGTAPGFSSLPLISATGFIVYLQ